MIHLSQRGHWKSAKLGRGEGREGERERGGGRREEEREGGREREREQDLLCGITRNLLSGVRDPKQLCELQTLRGLIVLTPQASVQTHRHPTWPASYSQCLPQTVIADNTVCRVYIPLY